jgi:hypothetical protein
MAMSDSNADCERTLVNQTGTKILYVATGLCEHQITVTNSISSVASSGAGGSNITVLIKPHGAPAPIPLLESDGITPVSITVGAADSNTGRCIPLEKVSISEVHIVGGSANYCVGYVAFEV